MDGSSRRPVAGRRAYALVVVATVCYTLLMFVWFSLPAYLATIIDELGLTGTQAGLLVGAVPFTYIPLALFSGVLVDRFGPGRSLAAGVVLYGLAQIGRSFAPDFLSLLALTVLVGVGATAITFGLPKLVSVLFPPDRTGLPSSIYLIGAAAGSAAVFAVGRSILGPLVGGWRPLFLWSGLVAVAYGLLWLLVARFAGIDRTDPGSGYAGSGRSSDSSLSLDSTARDLRVVLTHRELQLVVVVGTMFLLLNHSVLGWLPTILESRGLSPDRAGRTTSLFVAAFAAGILAVPPAADRLGRRRLALVVCGGVLSLGVVVVVFGSVGLLLFAGVVVAGFGVGGLSPLIRAIPPELDGIGARLTGTAVGFVFAVGEIGGFLGPVVIGTLHDTTGSFLPGLAMLAAAGVVVAIAGEFLRRQQSTDTLGHE